MNTVLFSRTGKRLMNPCEYSLNAVNIFWWQGAPLPVRVSERRQGKQPTAGFVLFVFRFHCPNFRGLGWFAGARDGGRDGSLLSPDSHRRVKERCVEMRVPSTQRPHTPQSVPRRNPHTCTKKCAGSAGGSPAWKPRRRRRGRLEYSR